MAVLTVVLCAVYVEAKRKGGPGCNRGEECWPSGAEVAALRAALDPSLPRILHFDGAGQPRPCAVPFGSADEQPLYGALGVSKGTSIEPLYANETVSDPSPCHPGLAENRSICMAATRNSPLSANSPQFVAFPVTAAHVQHCVRFAVKHKLCVAVLGTGHDFVNRHSCEGPSSILIRTTLLKDVAWDLRDARGLGSPAGSVRFGAGTTFSEAAKSAADHGRMVAQGWGITVGVAGWSLAGGHGPFGNALGLGVDNILAAEIVTADGELVVASSRSHPDLWWALRGGGGSTWGVAVSFTLRAHPLPAGGITSTITTLGGNMCPAAATAAAVAGTRAALNVTVDRVLAWQLSLSKNFSGLVFFTPTASTAATRQRECGARWTAIVNMVFMGPPDTLELTDRLAALAAALAGVSGVNVTSRTVTPFKDQWARASGYKLEPIFPVPWLGPSKTFLGGLPSVLVSRPVAEDGRLAARLKASLADCARPATDPLHTCNQMQLYQDVTGNVGAPQAANVSISPSFRSAFVHFIFTNRAVDAARAAAFYALGENSYMNEGAYEFEGLTWKKRLWGDNYPGLLAVKRKYDPHGVFWCRHCIGDDEW